MIETTSTFTIPEWYLTWCWDNEAIQNHWKQEWQEENGMLYSNIYPGDRFSIGRTRDIGVVTDRIIWADRKNERKSTHMYSIAGNLGGRWSSPLHNYMAEGYYLWIPTVEQLLALKLHDKAIDLFFYLANRADPTPLVQACLTAADNAGKADQDENWVEKRIYEREHEKTRNEMARCGISIDEAEEPEEAMKKEGTEDFHFFHVRIDNKPWKKIDSRNGEWSAWE